jgi:DNA adenine methylase
MSINPEKLPLTDIRTLNRPRGECQEILPFPGSYTKLSGKPFLRWAGGKTRLLKDILPFVPFKFANYYEPFLGSGAMFFAVRERATHNCFLTDLNEELMNAWMVIRECPEEFLLKLQPYFGKNSESDYYSIRNQAVPAHRVERAARFFYLNQTAWNGLWRVNKWGIFNVPWGDRPFRGISAEDVFSVSQVLHRNVSLGTGDFRDALRKCRPGDFVYLDPPYLPISDTSKFSGYTERRFRLPDLSELAEECRTLTRRGVSWIMSNRDSHRVRELFSFARIMAFTTYRSVAAQNKRNVQPAKSPELLILGE